MYVIEAKNKMGTAERRCRSKETATRIAAAAANAGMVYIPNPELNRERRYFPVESVRVYDAKYPDHDIDF